MNVAYELARNLKNWVLFVCFVGLFVFCTETLLFLIKLIILIEFNVALNTYQPVVRGPRTDRYLVRDDG